MRDDVLCGVEEPVASNEMMHATGDDGESSLATFGVPKLNRYSFVWARHKPVVPALLEQLLAANRISDAVLLGWSYGETGFDRIKNLRLTRALARSGWEVRDDGKLGLGIKSQSCLGLDAVPIPAPPRVGWAAALGQFPSLAHLLEAPFASTIRRFCVFHRMRPSVRMLQQLASSGAGIAYPAQGSEDHHGLVVIWPNSLMTAIWALLAAGEITEIRTGDAAASVWLGR